MIAQHLLQNFSPGLIGFPQDRQSLSGCSCGGAEVTGAMGGGGEVKIMPVFVTVAGAGVGADAGEIAVPHAPQNFISGLIGVPHAGQVKTTGGGDGTADTRAMVSPIFPPQFPQNFSSGSTVFPHEGQVRGTVSGSTGGGGMVTGGNTSPSDAPQCRQNFAFGTLLCPHSGQ